MAITFINSRPKGGGRGWVNNKEGKDRKSRLIPLRVEVWCMLLQYEEKKKT